VGGPQGFLGPLGVLRGPIEALGALLEDMGEEQHLVVVGGVAILLHGIRDRATADVDVIARLERSSIGLQLVMVEPFPATMTAAIRRVARDFALAENWLNGVSGRDWNGVSLMPPCLLEETTWHVVGGLHIGVAGRRALIALKLYAAADTSPTSVHTQDLLAMVPSTDELREAADWVRCQDVSVDFHNMLTEVVEYATRSRDNVGRR
jgi:hypothetical protein